VLAEGGLVDLFPAPPEPLVVEGPAEPLLPVGSVLEIAPSASENVESTSPKVAVASPEVDHPQTSPAETDHSVVTTTAVPTESPSGDTYVVKSGDTLSDIAESIYGQSRRYLDLYRANRDVLSDPDDLPVGTTLRLP
jgi:nucleoid-associated protein YgaU